MSETTAVAGAVAVGSWFGGLATHVFELVLGFVCKPVLSRVCPQRLRKYFFSPPLLPPIVVAPPPLISDVSVTSVLEKFEEFLAVGRELTAAVGEVENELRLLREQVMRERTLTWTIGAGTSPVVPANTT